MTYNIRYANTNDGINKWENRKDKVTSTIKYFDVDIIGMQEVLYSQLLDLKKELIDYSYIGVGREDGDKKGEFSPIFYKKKLFDLLESGYFWLSETPDKPTKGWDAACIRIVTWAKFKIKSNGKIFYFYNTHFDHIGKIARIKSSELLLSRLKSEYPLIVTGDFNCTETDSAYKLLTSKLFDTQKISITPHFGSINTYNGFNFDTSKYSKIDYIFTNKFFKVLNHATLSILWDNKFASDHFPVFTILKLINE